jgi:hypothetical protein
LLFVSVLSYGFGVIGALTGIVCAGLLVLAASLTISRSAARHTLASIQTTDAPVVGKWHGTCKNEA